MEEETTIYKLKNIYNEYELENDKRFYGLLLSWTQEILIKIESDFEKALEKYHPEIYNNIDYNIDIRFEFPSVVITFKDEVPEEWEPCKEIRELMFSFGFSFVTWVFQDGTIVRGMEKRIKNIKL